MSSRKVDINVFINVPSNSAIRSSCAIPNLPSAAAEDARSLNGPDSMKKETQLTDENDVKTTLKPDVSTRYTQPYTAYTYPTEPLQPPYNLNDHLK
jgi:hypothetical protein